MPADRPNVLLIMFDQQRHDWLGYRGADFVDTPHLDAIATSGKVFTQTICNSPVCAPSRIGLASGMRPHKLGALDNDAFLPHGRRTYYEELRDAGYYVACSGKLDLAKPDGYNGIKGHRPFTYSWGFTHPVEIEGKMHAGRGCPPNGPYTNWLKTEHPAAYDRFIAEYQTRKQNGYGMTEPSFLKAEQFEDVYIADRAIDFIENVEDDFPWHLFVSFVGPHNPFDPPAEYYEQYKDADMPEAIPYEPEGKCHRYQKCRKYATPEHILLSRRLYAAYIKLLDDQVGRLVQSLKDKGEYENTFILFAADHGEMMGDHMRYTKGVHYEASLRVPLIVSGPGIEPGTSEALVELNDVNPTICELAGVAPTKDIDAKSLLPLLKGETETHREVAASTLRYTDCLRTKEWKYIRHQDVDELYDLVKDPDERVNVASEHPQRCMDMKFQLGKMLLEGKAN